ncbi:hypothetical protein L873DRAFT_1204327 [Choiromyces venosus 120613-1]|uniref:NAD(P)-binding domain-containing protein n=1 Tax=Choiromyces venosus 120613-1 TaxID=1336337 RepID=A0A3N4JJN5_9PEZI|nr:hypothetical protein L873DRAFT_1204327 [Choiromyces venosus 120613-1]
MSSGIAVSIAGSTGLVGSFALQYFLSSPQVSQVYSLMRRAYPHPITDPESKLKPLVSSDISTWPGTLSSIPTAAFVSGLGTTRGDAGSLEAQRKIDFDLNLDLAKAAKAAGVKTYVLISAASADSASRFPYMKMKGELEDAVIELGFEKTAILRPGLIVGSREKTRLMEYPFHGVANFLGAISGGRLKDLWAQDADTIGKAAVRAALEEEVWEGKGKQEGGKRVWRLTQADIVAFGKQTTS